MTYASVKDDPTIKRDMRNGSIVSNPEELELYRVRKAKLLADRDRDREFREMKNQLNDIKQLLSELLELKHKPLNS